MRRIRSHTNGHGLECFLTLKWKPPTRPQRVWERQSRKTRRPLSAQRDLVKHGSWAVRASKRGSLCTPDTALGFPQPLCLAPCVQAVHLCTWEGVTGEHGARGMPSSTPSTFCAQSPAVAAVGQSRASPRGGGLAGDEEHTRSLRKKSLFVHISSVLLTAPSPPTSEATGAP